MSFCLSSYKRCSRLLKCDASFAKGFLSNILQSILCLRGVNVAKTKKADSSQNFSKLMANLSPSGNLKRNIAWKAIKRHSVYRGPAVQEKPIEPLAPEEVERLKATASRPEFRDMRFSLSLVLYGGIRPTEVSRLQAGDINWEEGHVIIRPRASKTGGGRAVPLRGVRGIRKRDRHIPRNSAIPRCCVPATWSPPGARMPRASGKVRDCPGAQKHTCKGRMEPRPDK